MSYSQSKIECGIHGIRNAAYVCQHLVDGEKQGCYLGYNPQDPDKLCPIAWCGPCEQQVIEQGGWTEKAVAFADMTAVCAKCYEQIREKNWLHNAPLMEDIICASFDYLQPYQDAFVAQFKVDQHPKWDWDQQTGLLVFSRQGKKLVKARIHFVGTYSRFSASWMWAWANHSLTEKVKSASRQVKALGEKHNLLKLVGGCWDATEDDGWEMTAVLAKQLNAIGVYRTADESSFTYMVITKAWWVS